KRRKHEIVEAVRNRFNDRIIPIYTALGFKDFSEIDITPDYTIRITRTHDGDVVGSWPLEALSTSERITLAITLLAVGKEQFVPDYPFFVLDEIITSYDPQRFEVVRENLVGIARFVIMTELAPREKTEGIEIAYSKSVA
ncbi:MAG: hypothetical protein ACE5IJ_10775, partial [Thermoplasmata archaeon]